MSQTLTEAPAASKTPTLTLDMLKAKLATMTDCQYGIILVTHEFMGIEVLLLNPNNNALIFDRLKKLFDLWKKFGKDKGYNPWTAKQIRTIEDGLKKKQDDAKFWIQKYQEEEGRLKTEQLHIDHDDTEAIATLSEYIQDAISNTQQNEEKLTLTTALLESIGTLKNNFSYYYEQVMPPIFAQSNKLEAQRDLLHKKKGTVTDQDISLLESQLINMLNRVFTLS